MAKEYEEVKFSTLRFYEVTGDPAEFQRGYTWKYWNMQGRLGIYIIAVVNAHKGIVIDWACYIGANPEGAKRERDGFMDVAEQGSKLAARDAFALFPQFKDCVYRG